MEIELCLSPTFRFSINAAKLMAGILNIIDILTRIVKKLTKNEYIASMSSDKTVMQSNKCN